MSSFVPANGISSLTFKFSPPAVISRTKKRNSYLLFFSQKFTENIFFRLRRTTGSCGETKVDWTKLEKGTTCQTTASWLTTTSWETSTSWEATVSWQTAKWSITLMSW